MDSSLIMPLMMTALFAACAWKRLPVYDLFVQGARNGLHTAVEVLPNLAAMLCAISLMQTSGLMDALCTLCAPLFAKAGLPTETAPLVLIRPLSGSGALAMLETILDQSGPDSRAGLIASTIMGSGETIFYILCVYTSGLKHKHSGYAIPCSLAGMAAGVWVAALLF